MFMIVETELNNNINSSNVRSSKEKYQLKGIKLKISIPPHVTAVLVGISYILNYLKQLFMKTVSLFQQINHRKAKKA